jgi:hypothetical protein
MISTPKSFLSLLLACIALCLSACREACPPVVTQEEQVRLLFFRKSAPKDTVASGLGSVLAIIADEPRSLPVQSVQGRWLLPVHPTQTVVSYLISRNDIARTDTLTIDYNRTVYLDCDFRNSVSIRSAKSTFDSLAIISTNISNDPAQVHLHLYF